MSDSDRTNSNPDRSVLNAAAKMLSEAHYFLHESASTYHDVVRFTANLNAFIQASRNVTFRVQAHKNDIFDFDRWYRPWRDYLASDQIMRWLSDARTEITKRKGLTAHSRATATTYYSYVDPLTARADVDPITPTPAVIASALRLVPVEIRPYATVEVSRRWEFDDLPDKEILVSLLHVIKVLQVLLSDLKDYTEEGHRSLPPIAVGRAEDIDCLGDLDRIYTSRHVASSGASTVTTQTSVEYDEEYGKSTFKRYNFDEHSALLPTSDDPFTVAEAVLSLAKHVLQRDKVHYPIFWFRKPDGWQMLGVAWRDKAEKYSMMHTMAANTTKNGWDALVAVAEAWTGPLPSPPEDLPPYFDLSKTSDRGEALEVYAATSEGEVRIWHTPFRRRLGRIRFEETEVISDDPALVGFLLPIRRVWAARRGEVIPDPPF